MCFLCSCRHNGSPCNHSVCASGRRQVALLRDPTLGWHEWRCRSRLRHVRWTTSHGFESRRVTIRPRSDAVKWVLSLEIASKVFSPILIILMCKNFENLITAPLGQFYFFVLSAGYSPLHIDLKRDLGVISTYRVTRPEEAGDDPFLQWLPGQPNESNQNAVRVVLVNGDTGDSGMQLVEDFHYNFVCEQESAYSTMIRRYVPYMYACTSYMHSVQSCTCML